LTRAAQKINESEKKDQRNTKSATRVGPKNGTPMRLRLEGLRKDNASRKEEKRKAACRQRQRKTKGQTFSGAQNQGTSA